MAERIADLQKEEEELNRRRDALLFAPKNEGDSDQASAAAQELIDIMKRKDALNKRAEKELARRKKIDNICIPIILIGLLMGIVCGIIAVVGFFRNGSFPPVSGLLSLGAFAVVVLDVIIMKVLNPDMKLF